MSGKEEDICKGERKNNMLYPLIKNNIEADDKDALIKFLG